MIDSFEPFYHVWKPFSLWKKLITVVAAFTLLPLRLFFIFLVLLVGWVLLRVGLLCRLPRRFFIVSTRLLTRLLLFLFGFYWIPRWYKPLSVPCTLVVNHCSLFDVLFLLYMYQPRFLAKDSVRSVPLVGPLCEFYNCIFVERRRETESDSSCTQQQSARQCSRPLSVERSSNTSTTEALREAQKESLVAVFPEGTTTNGRFLLKFKTGAFCAGGPVTPLLIQYSGQVSPCFETIPPLTYAFLMLTQYVQHVRLELLDPVSKREGESISSFASNVQSIMASRLNVPSTQYSYVDKLRLHNTIREGKGNLSWWIEHK